MTAPTFASSLDGVVPVSGAPSIVNSTIASTVDRGVNIAGAVISLSGVAGRTVGGTGSSARNNGGGPLNWSLSDSSGNVRFQIVNVSGTTYKFQYWNGASFSDAGTTWTFNVNIVVQLRVDFSGLNTGSGSVTFRMFNDADEVDITNQTVSGLNFSSITDILTMTNTAPAGSNLNVSAQFIQDASGQSTYVYETVFTADGTDTGGTGTFASVTKTGATYDTTFISMATSGLRHSCKSAARNYGSRAVTAMGFPARLRCGVTGPTQVKPYLLIGGVRYYWGTVTLTTSFTSYMFSWPTDPSTSLAWTLTNAQAAALELGIEVV